MKARILFHGAAVLVLVTTVVAAQTPSTPKKSADAAPKSQSANRQYSVPSVSEREASSGMASGKRQYSPVPTSRESSTPSVSEREASTGMASGKRQYSPVSISHESSAPAVSEREAQSGMASGRKSGSVIMTDREAQTGMATGRRQHEPILTVADESRNSAHAAESLSAEQTIGKSKDNMQNVSSNPMYKDNTMSGNNPLYEQKGKQAAPKPATTHETVEYKDGEDMTSRNRPGNHKTSNVKPASGTATTPNR